MTEEEQIKAVLYQFEDGGLVAQDPDMVLECIAEHVLGIGIGEQGFVSSREDIRHVLTSTGKADTSATHSLRYGPIKIMLHSAQFASVCTEVIVTSQPKNGQRPQESRFNQMLSLHKLSGAWKICALHASTPVISEEDIEAFPLKIAEKTLVSLRKRIGEEVYQEEERYRRAVLADTIAFYIINLTQDTFEKCQINGDTCAYVEPGASFTHFVTENTPLYVAESDAQRFIATFSPGRLQRAFRDGQTEVSCEYRLRLASGGYLWVSSVLRLVTDEESGDRKGILYVKDISRLKQEKTELLDKASRDGMTQLYHKQALVCAAEELLSDPANSDSVFVMLDVDDFKHVNDTYGHPIGDELLIKLARAIQKSFSEHAWVSRLGGDEFCVFIPHVGGDARWREELQALWNAIPAIRLSDAPEFVLSCSIGVACRQAEDLEFRQLYEKADKALYQAKKSGKGRIAIYTQE